MSIQTEMALFGQSMLVEFWRWRYEDPVTGYACQTAVHMTADEARVYPQARRIPGTLEFRELEIDFTDTTQRAIFPPQRC